MDFNEIGCEVMDWIHLDQDGDGRQNLLNAVMNFRVE
jgi:hypothetical protein